MKSIVMTFNSSFTSHHQKVLSPCHIINRKNSLSRTTFLSMSSSSTAGQQQQQPYDRRIEVMGGARTRKAGYCGHIPMMSAFDKNDNPFTKMQQNKATNRMTQDNVSLRKGMSSQTSYRAVMNKVEEKTRKDREEHEMQESPRAPVLDQELFGSSPPNPRLISGFSGHRPHYHFAVGESVNAATKETWRDYVFDKEKETHHHSHPRARPIADIIAEKAEEKKKIEAERKKKNLEKWGTEESPFIQKKNIPVC